MNLVPGVHFGSFNLQIADDAADLQVCANWCPQECIKYIITGVGVPFGDPPVVAGRVDVTPVLAERQSGDGLIVTLDDAQGLGGVVDVQIVDEARKRHGQQMWSLPQAGHLQLGTFI